MSPVGKFQQGSYMLPIFRAALIKKLKTGESFNDSPVVGVSGFEPDKIIIKNIEITGCSAWR